jgi:hypothetical protein
MFSNKLTEFGVSHFYPAHETDAYTHMADHRRCVPRRTGKHGPYRCRVAHVDLDYDDIWSPASPPCSSSSVHPEWSLTPIDDCDLEYAQVLS